MTEMKTEKDYKEMSDMFKDMEDIKDFGKIVNIENPSAVRGKTPEDIEDQCLSLCQQYLAGNWLTQTKDTIKVTRIVGGYVNQLYCIKINEHKNEEIVPQEVTIKFEGELPNIYEDRSLKVLIIAMVFSDKGLGPKVYGVFDKGIIQAYCKHRPFYKKEHDNPSIVDQVYRKLAHVHALDVPIKKAPDSQFPFGLAEELLAKARQTYDLEKEIEDFSCYELKNLDFDAEIKWFKDRINEIQSPVVFTHNDYRSSNLLITEPNDDLIICDFDTACYGYRGADFSKLYGEYGPGFVQDALQVIEDFPINDSDFGSVVALYVDECTKIHGKAFTDDPNNTVEHILRETKFFWAFGCIGFITMFMNSDPKTSIFTMPRKFAMGMANHLVTNYRNIKNLLIENNVISA